MDPSNDDTITAIATPAGQAGIGIIRISGPNSLAIARKIFRPKLAPSAFQSHRLYLGNLIDPDSGAMIDEVLLTYMRAPHTYTREDIIEINSHSGYMLLSNVLRLITTSGARLARPGEFTFRAFVNGRIDLTQAEAIVDIINCQSEKGLQLASEQIRGRLKRDIEEIRGKAIEILAQAEVAIDFPEEEHEIMANEEGVRRIREDLIIPVRRLISDHESRQIWVDGVHTVIVGRVNVGKSSLLNRLLNEDRAIVTPIPGTTRDVIESTLSIEGIPLRLADTAGLRRAADQVEKIGMHLTRQKMRTADLILAVMDQSEPFRMEDREILDSCRGRNALVVLNKTDLPPGLSPKQKEKIFSGLCNVSVSALTGDGLDELRRAIVEHVLTEGADLSSSHAAPNLRHRQALEEALDCFQRAVEGIATGLPMEIVALELRSGLDFLGQIIGETTPEDVLETIFSRFCLGK